jgi:hypothetical protein
VHPAGILSPHLPYMMGSRGAGFNRSGCEVMGNSDRVERRIREAGERARAEAAARKAAAEARREKNAPAPKELDGRDGPDPVRHGDWEVKGVASDF